MLILSLDTYIGLNSQWLLINLINASKIMRTALLYMCPVIYFGQCVKDKHNKDDNKTIKVPEGCVYFWCLLGIMQKGVVGRMSKE